MIFFTTIENITHEVGLYEICQKRILVYSDNIIDIKLKDCNRYQRIIFRNKDYTHIYRSI